MSRKGSELVELTCPECGAKFTMRESSIKISKVDVHLCKACRNRKIYERVNNMSEEERKEWYANKNSKISKGWKKQTPEQNEIARQHQKESWDDSRREKAISRSKNMWANRTSEEREENIKNLSDGRDKYWADQENRKQASEDARVRFNKLTEEQKEYFKQRAAEGRKEYLENLTPEEREAKSKRMSEQSKKWWASLNNEERLEIIKKSKENRKNLNGSKNELDFINELNKYHLEYDKEYLSKIIHPDFNNVFTVNPITGSETISPYHKWDFIIHLRDNDVLIDIDGSIHDPAKATTGYTLFNDSKRVYQTDGLSAYIVMVYDNKLSDETAVNNVNDDKTVSFKDLMNILSFMNLTEEEQNNIIKENINSSLIK